MYYNVHRNFIPAYLRRIFLYEITSQSDGKVTVVSKRVFLVQKGKNIFGQVLHVTFPQVLIFPSVKGLGMFPYLRHFQLLQYIYVHFLVIRF
jgi:hypothetical protein